MSLPINQSIADVEAEGALLDLIPKTSEIDSFSAPDWPE